jgi:serine/threonine protein kinase
MGVVHLAKDPAGRAVALKVLRAHVANDDEARRRLAREVATLRRVRHPQVAEVLDADVAGAVPYLVTRFVPGRSLEEEVRVNGPLPAGQVARIGRMLASALGAIHAAGVVHRDVKPANVMLVDGDPVLIDFGIAHVVDESRITRTGLVMGTPGYLSPELIYGGPVTEVTDWWAWGATLAFAATGRQPFGAGPVELVLERVRRGQSDLDGVEAGLRELLAATLTVDASRRPAAAELMAELDDVIAGVTTSPSVVDSSARHISASDDLTARAVPPPKPVRPAPPDATTVTPPLDATKRMPSPADGVIPPYPGTAPQQPVRGAPSGFPPRSSQPPSWTPQYGGQPPRGVTEAEYGSPAYGPPPGYPPYPQGQPVPYGASQYPGPWPGYQQQESFPQPQQTPYPWAQQAGFDGGQGATGQEQQQDRSASRPALDPAVRVTGSLAAIMFVLAGIGAVAPGGAIVLVFCLSVLARLVQRSSAGLQRRREELGGRRPTDVAVTVAALPWRLFMSVVMSLVAFLLPALVAASMVFIVGAAAARNGNAQPGGALALFCGMLAGTATAWWGPGGRSLRMGSRAIVRTITGGRGGRIALVSLCLLVLLAVWMVAGQSDYAPDWAPFPMPSIVTG